MNKIQQVKNEFNNMNLIPIFEVEVKNKFSNELDYIVFDISIKKNTIYAQHVALTTKEEKSKKIAFKKVVLNSCFGLDQTLQELYTICIESICDSEFYELT